MYRSLQFLRTFGTTTHLGDFPNSLQGVRSSSAVSACYRALILRGKMVERLETPGFPTEYGARWTPDGCWTNPPIFGVPHKPRGRHHWMPGEQSAVGTYLKSIRYGEPLGCGWTSRKNRRPEEVIRVIFKLSERRLLHMGRLSSSL